MVIFCSWPVARSFARDTDDAVGVDVERDFDLRHAARRRRQARQVEAPDRAVVARQRALALQHVDLDARLVIDRRREGFALPRRNRRVPRDQRRHDAAQRLDAERQRSDVEQQHVGHLAGEHAALHRRADGDDFVRIDALVRLLAEVLAHELLDLGHPRRAADQDDFINLLGIDARIGQRLLHRRHRPLQQVVHQLLELGPRQLGLQVLRPVLIGGHERQVDVRFHRRGQLDLGLLRRFLQPLERHAVLAEVDSFGALELRHQPLDDAVVDVVAAEVGVAVGGLHFDNAVADLEHRDVKRAAAEVVDGNRFVLFLSRP